MLREGEQGGLKLLIGTICIVVKRFKNLFNNLTPHTELLHYLDI